MDMKEMVKDMTVVYYTSNWLDTHNPYFLENTKKELLKAIGDLPMVIVSHKPTMFGSNSTNIVMGDIGRSHLNIYKQILTGCKASKTKYVAMAEDDILYSYEHFHTYVPPNDKFAYDMCKWSIFTWTKPPMFSFRNKRMVINSLVAKRDMLIDSLEERFKRIEVLKNELTLEQIESRWGDPGRYEDLLGVKVRPREEFWSTSPNIVFTHPEAYGYLNHGKQKKLGDLRAIELPYWGRAEDVLKLYFKI